MSDILTFDRFPGGILYTDGSSSTKTGKCGWACVGQLLSPSGYLTVQRCGFGDGSNQVAELYAFIYAMQIAPADQETLIVSDSRYSIDSITGWRQKWESSGYLNFNGDPIKHQDLIRFGHRIHDIKPLLRFMHVRGHTGVDGNEIADRLSVLARHVAEGRQHPDKVKEFLAGHHTGDLT